ncbi:MAG: hypothetical protein JXA03_05955 [Bacteroidales bacterium]|nr:hypothetical protein [Bacteroidales bacterium]
MLKKSMIFLLGLVFISGGALVAQDFEYIGATKCKMCHNKPATGEQYNKWLAGPHAKAMASLSNEKSKAYAKEHNIADPTKEASCIKCHSTAGGIDAGVNLGIKIEEGVSCESCHGPGSVYKTNVIMKDKAKALQSGLVEQSKEVCEKCHNKENPFHKPFNYAEYAAKIAHPNPAK